MPRVLKLKGPTGSNAKATTATNTTRLVSVNIIICSPASTIT